VFTDLEESWEDQSKDLYMDLEDSQDVGGHATSTNEDAPGISAATIVGKLKSLCPSLYFSLTSWERDHLDNTYTSERLPQTSSLLGKVTKPIVSILALVVDSVDPIPKSMASLEPFVGKTSDQNVFRKLVVQT
jgi:hypothetical protein